MRCSAVVLPKMHLWSFLVNVQLVAGQVTQLIVRDSGLTPEFRFPVPRNRCSERARQ